MKHTSFYTVFLFLILFNVSGTANATINLPTVADSTLTATDPNAQVEANNRMLLRLEEIKAMDKSNLTHTEKKALRQEVKTIKHELTVNGGGVYISVGALLLIILLLVILL